MRLRLLLVALCCSWLLACAEETTPTRTQVTLRLQMQDAALLDRMTHLRISVARKDRDWVPTDSAIIERRRIRWPLDIPIVPTSADSTEKPFEVIVDVLDGLEPIARTRAIGGYVRDRLLVLELWLYECPRPANAFCSDENCHGEDCEVCARDGSCKPVVVHEADALPPFEPDKTPIEPSLPDAGSDASAPSRGGERADGGRAPASSVLEDAAAAPELDASGREPGASQSGDESQREAGAARPSDASEERGPDAASPADASSPNAPLTDACSGSTCGSPSCTPNAARSCQAGDSYFVDSCGKRGSLAQSCCGRGCSNGICAAVDPRASKACADGDVYWLDSCGTRGALAESCMGRACANGACESACPSEMVATSMVCIDKFETSLYTQASCTGTPLAAAPSGFPPNVASQGLSGMVTRGSETIALTAPTATVYACSVRNVMPAGNLSYYQAKRACENSGKRLCTWQEWLSACSRAYPYGPAYVPGRCNTGESVNLARTASFAMCEGVPPGLFDLGGNVYEWVICDAEDGNTCGLMGALSDDACNGSARIYSPGKPEPRWGVRCCKDL